MQAAIVANAQYSIPLSLPQNFLSERKTGCLVYYLPGAGRPGVEVLYKNSLLFAGGAQCAGQLVQAAFCGK